MAVLLLHIVTSSEVRVKDLVIHSTAYQSYPSAVEHIHILYPQHDGDGDAL